MLLSCELKNSNNILGSEPLQKTLVSSANNTYCRFWVEYGKSFIYIKKRRGPRIEPCGTPQCKSLRFEETPLITINCLSLIG